MKILHITAARMLTNGQRQQLLAELNAVKNLPEVQWKIVALHNGLAINSFETNFPKIFRSLFLRKLYCWLYVLKNGRKYDFVLFRHLTFDPFVLLLGWFVNNRITIHHAKEIEELKLIKKGWQGFCAATLEQLTGKVSANQVRGVIGVTPEIADYVCEVHKVNKPKFFYPNGIDVDSVEMLSDNRNEDINAAFICGTFSSWHGLEELIDSTSDYSGKGKVNIHLIGKLSQKQRQLINKLQSSSLHYVCHGFLEPKDYRTILNKCDFGIGSISLYKKGLTEAVTLKVREYLAMGLPVIASHKDAALPDDHPYYFKAKTDDIFEYAIKIKKENFTREEVREKSRKYIAKNYWLYLLKKNLTMLQEDFR